MARWMLLLLTAASGCGQDLRVDPRMELLSAVGLLADYNLITQSNTPYRRAVLERFQAFRQHAAVRRFADVSRRGFNFDAPVSTMACLSNPPELRLQANPSDCGAARIGGDSTLRNWVDELRDFSSASNFPAFFEENGGLYAQLVEQVKPSLTGDVGAQMESYFARPQASYAVMLNPLLTGNYGLRVPAGDGRFHTMISIAAVGQVGGIPQFQSGLSLRLLMWHEFGHSFVNPVIEARASLLRESEALFDPIRERMTGYAYSNWLTTVIEHVVRAAVARMAAANVSESEGMKEILRQRSLGFAYVGDVAERLKEFEGTRESGGSFDGFADRLLSVLSELLSRVLPASYYAAPYAGTINSVLGDRSRLVYVLPTAERDAAALEAARNYVVGIRNRFAPAAPMMDDVEALGRDLGGSLVVAYGTLDGNLWLKQHRELIPVSLDGYEGKNLRLIVSYPNPANAEAAVVAYTAADAADVVGINAVFHGPTAYVVADGTAVLKAGEYRFEDGRWVAE